jgi:hypothetical protein
VKKLGKGGTVLGIIGILIGASGLIFGIWIWSSSQNNSNPNKVYYSANDGPFSITPETTILEIPNLNVSFSLSSPASVYLSFTCHASIAATTGLTNAFFFFTIDGVNFDTIFNRVGTQNGGSTTIYHFAVHLQHVIESMAAGTHNVTVRVSKDHAFDSELSDMTLCAQTFAT